MRYSATQGKRDKNHFELGFAFRSLRLRSTTVDDFEIIFRLRSTFEEIRNKKKSFRINYNHVPQNCLSEQMTISVANQGLRRDETAKRN